MKWQSSNISVAKFEAARLNLKSSTSVKSEDWVGHVWARNWPRHELAYIALSWLIFWNRRGLQQKTKQSVTKTDYDATNLKKSALS